MRHVKSNNVIARIALRGADRAKLSDARAALTVGSELADVYAHPGVLHCRVSLRLELGRLALG